MEDKIRKAKGNEATVLDLQNTSTKESGIIDITPLAELTKWESLDLSFNRITDIELLAGLTKLKRLNLRSHEITDLTPLAGVSNLTALILRDNPIPDDQKAMLRKALPNSNSKKFGGMWIRPARRSHFDGRPGDPGIDIRSNPCTVGASATPPTPNPDVTCCH